jgi:hypothetical protein
MSCTKCDERNEGQESFPVLPNRWKPDVIVRYGSYYIAYYRDGDYSHRFKWDGFSPTYLTHECEYDFLKAKLENPPPSA